MAFIEPKIADTSSTLHFDKQCSSCCSKPKWFGKVTETGDMYYVWCDSPSCIEKCKRSLALLQQRDRAYGPLFHLRDSDNLTVIRSNGNPDNGWKIKPWVTTDEHGVEIIFCKKSVGGLEKWVSVDEILRLNPLT
jgi:hypothetical protein